MSAALCCCNTEPVFEPSAKAEEERSLLSGRVPRWTTCREYWRIQMQRLAPTLEVACSKMFCSGCGWEIAAQIMQNAGVSSSSLGYAFSTGVGDGLGVLTGQTAAIAIKLSLGIFVDPEHKADIYALSALEIGLWLSIAAFCSGIVWQPAVNCFHQSALHFNAAALCVGVLCGLAFFATLQTSRAALSCLQRTDEKRASGITAPSWKNAQRDGLLSLSIIGAEACFLTTDTSFGSGNWARTLFGVYAHTPGWTAVLRAGASTAVGFSIVQLLQNLVVFPGRSWLDVPAKFAPPPPAKSAPPPSGAGQFRERKQGAALADPLRV